ncbi:hypothetical protein N9039_02905 [Verrucomicrobiales bacterium]|nr:hypothetical protein [Verrucomicrobiales bacterium]
MPGNQKNNASLTAEQAAEVISKANEADRYYLNLDRLTSIGPDAARELAKLKSESGDLLLNGLTSINKEVAEELARFNGYRLQLNGLTNINNEVAEALANFQGKVLSLNGLASIDKETVKELAKFNGDWLILGLTSLDREDARVFAKGEGNGLSFDRLSSIDKDVAHELSRFQGYRLSLRGLTSISKDVAHELAKFSPAPNGPSKYLGLDGLTSCDREVAHELAKFHGQLGLAAMKSINSDVAREFTQFQGSSLDIYNVTTITRDDLNILRDGLRRPDTENSYRAMMPWKLDDGTDPKKWNGKLTEFHKDGSKSTETVYKNGNVAVRMEWDEAGNLIKQETSPFSKSSDVDADEQSVQMSEVTNLEREYPLSDLNYRGTSLTDRSLYAKGEHEPFTGVAFSNHSNGKRSMECSFLNGKKSVQLKWDKDGNLIEKETY